MLDLHCRFGDWSVKETDWLNSNPCISGKPVVYLINLNEDKFIKKKSKWLPKVQTNCCILHLLSLICSTLAFLQGTGSAGSHSSTNMHQTWCSRAVGWCMIYPQYIVQEAPLHLRSLRGDFVHMQVFEWVKNHGGEPIIPFSGVFESKLVDMPEDERDKYCKEVCLASCATVIALEVQSRCCPRMHCKCCTCMHIRVFQAARSMICVPPLCPFKTRLSTALASTGSAHYITWHLTS